MFDARHRERLRQHYEPAVYALLRIVAGFMFLWHGVHKLFDWPNAIPNLTTQAWIGGLIELVTGVLVMLGLFTRPAAFLASGTMAVAYFQFHWKLQLADWKFLPAINGGELAALYCFAFLLIAFRGAGIWSLDGQRSSKR